MQIEFDPAKDALNQQKHGIALGQAQYIEWDTAIVWTDERRDYGEDRQCALAYIGPRLHFVAFVMRGDACRIISLRRANLREIERYANT